METITKVSETEIEISKTIPQVIIPEKVETTVVSVTQLKADIDNCNKQILQNIEWRKVPQAEVDKINNDIANLESQITEKQAYIDEAVNQGIVVEEII